MALTCPKCGKELDEAIVFCPYCGQRITEEGKKQVSKKVIIGLLVAVIALVGVVTWLILNRLDETEKAQVNLTTVAIASIDENINNNSEAKIVAAETMYDSLSSKCKRHVKNRKELISARKEYNALRASGVIELIEKIGEVDLQSEGAINAAEKAYNALSEDQQKLVTNSKDLSSGIERLSELKIADVEAKIDSIGDVSLLSQKVIDSARESYNALNDSEKTRVSNASALETAETLYGELAVKNAVDSINAIGNVTLSSEKLITDAEKAYNEVPTALRGDVNNLSTLTSARTKLNELKEEQRLMEITLQPGETISTAKWDVVYKNTNIQAKILPNNTSGYYYYYYAPDDQTFIDIVLQIKNIDVDILGVDGFVTDCKVEYDGSKYNKECELFAGNGSSVQKIYSWDGLGAQESITLHAAIKMPREIQTNGKPISLTCKIAGVEKRIVVRE